ncbi:MAG: arylsulfatase, partial [Verrucomicrobia bacterium]|nr:arylsulfatase [Verrucomicrobiota bacterium]
LIVFTSDNGCSPAAKIEELQAKGHQPNGVLRGHKADIFEGGHRVPFVLRWPAAVKAGSVAPQLVGQIDLFATFAEITGAKPAEGQGEDSFSFASVLADAGVPSPRRSIISHSINGNFAIRDGAWKLSLCPGSGGWSAPRPGSKEEQGLPAFQLYDLASDLGETRNLAEQEKERVNAMKAALEKAVAAGRTTPGPDLRNDAEISIIKRPAQPKAGKNSKAKAKTSK